MTKRQAFLYGVAVGHIFAATGKAGIIEAIRKFLRDECGDG